jgi:hypothetical protein
MQQRQAQAVRPSPQLERLPLEPLLPLQFVARLPLRPFVRVH